MEWLQNFSVSHSPEFFRLCVFFMLVIMIVQLEKLNKHIDNWCDLFVSKVDTLPVDEDLSTKLQYAYTSGFDHGCRKIIDDFDLKFEGQEKNKPSEVD